MIIPQTIRSLVWGADGGKAGPLFPSWAVRGGDFFSITGLKKEIALLEENRESLKSEYEITKSKKVQAL